MELAQKRLVNLESTLLHLFGRVRDGLRGYAGGYGDAIGVGVDIAVITHKSTLVSGLITPLGG